MLSRTEAKVEQQALTTRYAQARMLGQGMRTAAKTAGATGDDLANPDRRLEAKGKRRIAELLAEHGAGDDDVARAVGEALTATRTGKFGVEKDHATRLSAGRFVAEITNQLKSGTSVNVAVQINMPSGVAESFAAAMLTGETVEDAEWADELADEC